MLTEQLWPTGKTFGAAGIAAIPAIAGTAAVSQVLAEYVNSGALVPAGLATLTPMGAFLKLVIVNVAVPGLAATAPTGGTAPGFAATAATAVPNDSPVELKYTVSEAAPVRAMPNGVEPGP